ncbi:hypothetical protein BX600DRAFT_510833 [Xylariales sp. PMI_506]|nr:hypothetical protein BX600DRAFT_510833 [Xylariales sp. PMI_506]
MSFAQLPFELRQQIWDEASNLNVLERIVVTQVGRVLPTRALFLALLMVNHEARQRVLRWYPLRLEVYRVLPAAAAAATAKRRVAGEERGSGGWGRGVISERGITAGGGGGGGSRELVQETGIDVGGEWVRTRRRMTRDAGAVYLRLDRDIFVATMSRDEHAFGSSGSRPPPHRDDRGLLYTALLDAEALRQVRNVLLFCSRSVTTTSRSMMRGSGGGNSSNSIATVGHRRGESAWPLPLELLDTLMAFPQAQRVIIVETDDQDGLIGGGGGGGGGGDSAEEFLWVTGRFGGEEAFLRFHRRLCVARRDDMVPRRWSGRLRDLYRLTDGDEHDSSDDYDNDDDDDDGHYYRNDYDDDDDDYDQNFGDYDGDYVEMG